MAEQQQQQQPSPMARRRAPAVAYLQFENGCKERFTAQGTVQLCSLNGCKYVGRYWLRPCMHSFCVVHGFRVLDSFTIGLGVPYEAAQEQFSEPKIMCPVDRCGQELDCIVLANQHFRRAVRSQSGEAPAVMAKRITMAMCSGCAGELDGCGIAPNTSTTTEQEEEATNVETTTDTSV